jgi:alkylated DNA nucleotide flippase Atl1
MPYQEKRRRLGQTGLAMTHAIVEQRRWTRTEILARAEDLADRAIAVWPGPDGEARGTSPRRDWTLLHDAVAAIPSGTWTTYGELAEVVGSAPMPVAVHLSTMSLPNSHRILTSDGTPQKEATQADDGGSPSPREILTGEGVHFNQNGQAAPNQRTTAVELAELLQLSEAIEPPSSQGYDVDPSTLTEHEHRFHRQLGERGGPDIARAVSDVIAWWTKHAGTFWYGSSATGRCTPFIHYAGTDYWMLNIYPEATEIPFRSLKLRAPFDDPEMREELRRRLNEAPQVEIPQSKIELLPNFPNSLLTDNAVLDVVISTLDWFLDQINKHNMT